MISDNVGGDSIGCYYLDLILLLLVLIPILYFTVKMAVKHAIEEILVSKEKFKENTDK